MSVTEPLTKSVNDKQGITLGAWTDDASYISLNGHRIAYWQAGSGEPLLLIHGFPTAAWDWQYLWHDLAQQYRVITLDLLGYGLSDKPWPHQYRIAEQADLIMALTDALDIDKYHLLAHDYGDTVAQELLARHNLISNDVNIETNNSEGFINSLCLLNGGLFPETHRPVFTQKLLISPLGSLFSRFFTKKKLSKSFSAIFGENSPPDPKEIDGFWSLIENNNGQRVMSGLIRYMVERKQNRSRWVGALQQSRLPIRVINGVDDPISGEHMLVNYEKLIPRPDVVRLKGIGHYPQVEAPELVQASYLAFRKKIST